MSPYLSLNSSETSLTCVKNHFKQVLLEILVKNCNCTKNWNATKISGRIRFLFQICIENTKKTMQTYILWNLSCCSKLKLIIKKVFVSRIFTNLGFTSKPMLSYWCWLTVICKIGKNKLCREPHQNHFGILGTSLPGLREGSLYVIVYRWHVFILLFYDIRLVMKF